jgi:uncharacterized protein (TIGR02266 family)
MNKKIILLVDDVHFFLEQEKTFFNRGEFDFLLARSGKEALQLVREKKPDLVFMDLYMPEMDGDTCCYTIKNDAELKHIPVIMVTQGTNEDDFERCWQAGCDDIIVKPINKIYFVAVTRRFLHIVVRKNPRFAVRLRIQYQPESTPQKLLTNYSVNLSTGGVFIETTELLNVGTPLNVEFILPGNGATIRCVGRVAWVNHPELLQNQNLPGGMGIQFQTLTFEEMNAIRQFIKKEGLVPSW